MIFRRFFDENESGEFIMRKLMTFVSVLTGVLTFAAVAYAGRDGSTFSAAYACIPALICIMTAIAGDRSDGQHLDLDDAEADQYGY